MTVASQTVAARLAGIVGAANVSADPVQLALFEIDGKRPSSIAQPGSAEEIAELLKFAAAEKLALVATGARTKLYIGFPPRQYDLAVDMTRLDRIVSYDPGDLTLSVEAGVPLCKLQSALSEHHQFLPLAVPFMNRSTVGGTIASGMDTPLRQLYGTPRDYVLGMEFVTGEGTLAKSGGRVVKNVTGYDIHKLMIGALGTLGVITKLNFRTFPQPHSSRGFVALFSTSAQAVDTRHLIAQSPLRPLTIELFSPGAADLFSSEAATQLTGSPMIANPLSRSHWALTVGFSGNANLLARYESDLRAMAQKSGAQSVTILAKEDLQPAWARKREFVPISLAAAPAATIVKVSVLPSQLNEILTKVQSHAENYAVPCVAMARGCGVAYFALLPKARDEDTRTRISQAVDQIQATASGLGGNSVIPWCPSEWKGVLRIWGPDRGASAAMQKIKKTFDPHGILSPGRFVGGI
jgi:glycolate oxidase FAD binding subunit